MARLARSFCVTAFHHERKGWADHHRSTRVSSKPLTLCARQDMSAAEIKALTQPPSAEHAQLMTLRWLNDKFPSFDQLQDSDDLERLVQRAASEAEQLKAQVNPFTFPPELSHLSSRRSSASFFPGPRRLHHCPDGTRCRRVPRDCTGTGAHPRLAF